MADYSSNFTVAALTAAAPPLVLLVTTHLMIQLVRLEAPTADDTSERQVALKSPTEAETAVLCVHVLKLASEGHELAAVATRTGLSVEVVDAVIAAAEDELQVAPEEDRYLAPA